MTTAQTNPVPQPGAPLPTRIARALLNLPTYGWLIGCGSLSAVIYYLGFARRYSLAEFGTLHYQSVATLNHMSVEGAFLYFVTFAVLFGLYWFGLRRGLRPPTRREWLLVVGFAILFNGVLLVMYPMDAADLYDYIIRGRITAVYGLNPMQNVPNDVRSDPFYYFSAPTWYNTPSAYGPAWEMVAALGSRLAGNDYTTNVIVFKLISVIGYALAALFIALTLRIIAPRRALTGFYLFAWNPLIIYMTAGIGHNDALMMAFVALSIYLLARRWYILSTLAMLMGALVKFMPGILIPILAIVAWRELRGHLRLRYLALSAILGLLLIVLIYGPFWVGFKTLGLDRRTSMYTDSLATLVRQTISPLFNESGEASQTPVTNNVIKNVVLVLFGLFYVDRLWTLFTQPHQDDPVYPIRQMLTILTGYLLFAALWFQSWYVIWLVVLAALLDNTPLRRLVLLLSYCVLWEPFMYGYVTLRPDGWAALPWRDLLPVMATVGVAWLYILYYWLTAWLRRAQMTPLRHEIGLRLQAARETAHLTIPDLADQLDLRSDDLSGYERGDRAISLDHLQAISQALNIPITALVQD